MRFTKSTLTM